MSAGRSAGGLRGELTEFVGRRAELARVREALEGARLVTLTGPGGIGKTRLALRVAAGAGRAFADGVWLAELGGLRDPGLLVDEVARSLGLSDRSARWAVASLADHLQDRQVLLVLDGCEHLADACAVLADALLRDCPGLRILATSRHVLGVAGEVTISVPPMTVPTAGDPAAPEDLLRFEAVRLFAGRGAAVLPGFAVDARNGTAVAGVCRAVDGIPLAVELAAVRLRSLSPGRGNERLLRRRHLAWYAALAGRQEAFGPGRAAWIAALDADHENLRAALEFCLSEPGQVAAGAQLACDLWRYWETHGHLTEGRRVLAALLGRLGPDDPQRPRALWSAGYLAGLQGDIPEAHTLLEAGAAAGRAVGDLRAVAYALTYIVSVLYYLGEPARGQAAADDALRLHREAGDQIGVAQALMAVGYMYLFSGEPQLAAERFVECASVCESSGNVWYHTYAQWGLATARWLLGDRDGAAAPACVSLRAMRDLDDPIGIALCLDTLAWIAAGKRQALRALTLLSAADAAWSAIGIGWPNTLYEQHAEALNTARAATSDSAYREATAKGAAMGEAEAIAFALGESPRPTAPISGRPAGGRPRLTRREQHVAELIARGRSNGQIAAALIISARTVETHVQHIMDKLGCSTRAQIAAWSAAQPPAGHAPNIRTGIGDSPDAGGDHAPSS